MTGGASVTGGSTTTGQTETSEQRAMTPAEDHAWIGDEFTVTVEAVDPAAWDQPAPPQGWVARDVVRHLTEWLSAFLESSTDITLPSGPSVDDDPVGAWRTHTRAVQALLDDPNTADQVHDFPHIGSMTLSEALAMIYTNDVFMHRWDLARATGQDDTLDPDRCAEMVAAMEPMDAALRSSGHFGPRLDVADDADAQTKLLAFIGRHR
ncbi:maleylpyruvate isomerase family mycothiol-dependent enzyme [soil metagenome]